MDIASLRKLNQSPTADQLRDIVKRHAKSFKTSWINLGQTLYSIWKDKLFHEWGFEKFEHYTQKEIGLKKSLSIKLLKAYLFLEEDEPEYLKSDFGESRDAVRVPHYDAIDVLRLAKNRNELNKHDYLQLKKDIFDKGKDASVVKKDLTALIKERKVVDPEAERAMRNAVAVKKVLSALISFKKDMQSLKLIPHEIIKDADELIEKLQSEVS